MGGNAEALRRAFEMLNQGSPQGMLDLYDDQARLEISGSVIGGAYQGKKAIAEVYQKLATPLIAGSAQEEIRNLVETGDTVVVEHTTKLMPAAGKEVHFNSADVLEFRGGKIVNHRAYNDTEAMARLMGGP